MGERVDRDRYGEVVDIAIEVEEEVGEVDGGRGQLVVVVVDDAVADEEILGEMVFDKVLQATVVDIAVVRLQEMVVADYTSPEVNTDPVLEE